MYYEEKFANGIWWWRSTPDGPWENFTVAQYVRKIEELQKFRSHATCSDCGSYNVTLDAHG